MQTSPRVLLKGWSERSNLYPDISNVSSSGKLLEFRCVSERHYLCRIYEMQDTVLRETV